MTVQATGVVLFGLLLAAAPARAHHAFSAEFDASKCSDVTGILTKVNYENPHSYIFVDVTNADGKVVEATFQLSSTTNLRRGGADRPTLMKSVGKTVTVRGCAARTGEPNRYAAPWMKLADGTIQRVGQDVEGNLGAAER
jgi:uncharacterized protein DUF6152